MLQVLHINSNYLTSKLHENLLDRLENEEIHNTVYMPIKEETRDDFLYESKYEVYSPITFRDIDKFIFSYKQDKIYNKLQKIVNLNKFDVAHAHTLFTDGNIAYQLNKHYNIPYVVTVRGYTDIDSFFKIRVNLRKRGRQILKNASKVIFLSEINRKDLLEKYIHDDELANDILNKSQIIPNGIDDFYFENEGQPKQLNSSQPIRFIQVSKVKPIKNILGSIHGIEQYSKNTGKEVKFTYVGKIENENYHKKIEKENSGITTYHEAVPREELIQIYRNHDIFIMPSFSETFGLVYPEAMSQGLPTIYTRGQGFDGQYENGYVGYPVSAEDPNDIAEKIDLIVKNYEKISKNVLQGYKKFNWDNLSENYVKIYLEIK